ncbi:dystrophin-like isoform X3 [Panulirus ornatus]|uniref:dystrophin-like isoform X3 n=1 Tax=Panulirus ornatus TaxID=150431 RepID=UPI003A85A276
MVETMEGHVLEAWAMARTSSGVPYYVNHRHGVTQWDHPEYVRILEEIQTVNSVKYAAYRTACKLHRLQTRLKFHEVSLHCVASAFDNAGLRAGENNDLIEVKQVEQVIQKILYTTYKQRHVQVVPATQLTVNLLLNVYDLGRIGMVQVLGCKVLLVVLCGGRLQEKYRYLFSQVADHNNCCTRRRLAALLRDLARIPELLSEQPSFGLSLVSAAVESCFKEVEGEVGVTEEVLLSWLLQEPQTLVWWTTLYRLSAAELVCHDVKCGVCKQRPIIGLRYQCLWCLGYNLCQDCFLHARTSRRHKLTHPIQEYCHETNGKEWRRALMKTLRHRLSSHQGCNKQRYLAIPSSPDTGCNMSSLLCESGVRRSWSECSEGEEERELFSRTILHVSQDDESAHTEEGSIKADEQRNHCHGSTTEPAILPTSPRHQIHSVIMHLQEGHSVLRQLEEGIVMSPVVEVVQQYTQQLQTQINKLKAILQVENPCETPLKPTTSLLPIRMPFTPYQKNIHPPSPVDQSSAAQCTDGPKVVSQPSKLPSFTEVNFSDLTSLTSQTSSVSCPVVLPQKSNANTGQDDAVAEVREELENILQQLDQIFPLTESDNYNVLPADSGGVVEAACELGDVLAEYVSIVPSQPD